MFRIIHPIAGTTALATIVTFWLATVWSELLGSPATVIAVKALIPWGFLILVPALAAASLSGFRLSAQHQGSLATRKQKRMPFIAANGVLILIPSALFLSYKAQRHELDALFYVVQAVELVGGCTNITLLALNMRDGMRLASNRRHRPT
ncbi:MAG: hypothetical protein P1U49_05510 [Minwuia sp.]|nr:hypothetical protein [Minwuia sp.]